MTRHQLKYLPFITQSGCEDYKAELNNNTVIRKLCSPAVIHVHCQAMFANKYLLTKKKAVKQQKLPIKEAALMPATSETRVMKFDEYNLLPYHISY